MPPIFAPLAKGKNHRQQRLAFGGQRIDHLTPVSRIGIALENFAFNQLCQPIGQDIASNSETGLELLKVGEPVQRATKNQERPFFSDQLDRRWQWAAE